MSIWGILRGFGLKVGPTTRRTYVGRIRELIAGHSTSEVIATALPKVRDALVQVRRRGRSFRRWRVINGVEHGDARVPEFHVTASRSRLVEPGRLLDWLDYALPIAVQRQGRRERESFGETDRIAGIHTNEHVGTLHGKETGRGPETSRVSRSREGVGKGHHIGIELGLGHVSAPRNRVQGRCESFVLVSDQFRECTGATR